MYNVSVTPLGNGDLLCYGRHKMQPTTTDALRHAVFLTPPISVVASNDPSQPGSPVVLLSIDSSDQGTSLGPTSLKFTPGAVGSTSYLQIDIDATTPGHVETTADFWCNITVIGTPPPAKD